MLPILGVFAGLAAAYMKNRHMVSARKGIRHSTALVTGLMFPAAALAQGQEVLLLPAGQLAAAFAVGIVVWLFTSRGVVIRFLVIVSAVATASLLWVTPITRILGRHPDQMEYFLIGLVPPTAVAIVAALILSLFKKRP